MAAILSLEYRIRLFYEVCYGVVDDDFVIFHTLNISIRNCFDGFDVSNQSQFTAFA